MTRNTSNYTYIALDIGGTNLRVALVDENGTVLKKKSFPTPQAGGAKELNKAAVDAVLKLGKRALGSALCIGISVAGSINQKKGTFLNFYIDEKPIPIVKILEDTFTIPVTLLNDAIAATYAEYTIGHGKKKNVENLVYVTVSTGIGTGAVVDGKLLLGRNASAGHLGHALVPNALVPNALTEIPQSWEYFAAGKASQDEGIVHSYYLWCKQNNSPINKKIKSPKHIFAGIEKKDKQLKDFFETISAINAAGVLNIILAYNPQVIVFGGGIGFNHWNILRKGIKKHIDVGLLTPLPKFTCTELRDDIALIGAALWARDQRTTSKTN